MTSLTSSEWQGAFLPFRKHRLGTGDISNHLAVVSIILLSDLDEEEYEGDPENEYGIDELTELGDGPRAWLVKVGFLPGFEETAYQYVINLPAVDDEYREVVVHDPQMMYAELWDADTEVYIPVRELRKRDPRTYGNLEVPDAHEALHLIGEDLSK